MVLVAFSGLNFLFLLTTRTSINSEALFNLTHLRYLSLRAKVNKGCNWAHQITTRHLTTLALNIYKSLG